MAHGKAWAKRHGEALARPLDAQGTRRSTLEMPLARQRTHCKVGVMLRDWALAKLTDEAVGKPREVSAETLHDGTGRIDDTPESFRGPLAKPPEALGRLHGKMDATRICYRGA